MQRYWEWYGDSMRGICRWNEREIVMKILSWEILKKNLPLFNGSLNAPQVRYISWSLLPYTVPKSTFQKEWIHWKSENKIRNRRDLRVGKVFKKIIKKLNTKKKKKSNRYCRLYLIYSDQFVKPKVIMIFHCKSYVRLSNFLLFKVWRKIRKR